MDALHPYKEEGNWRRFLAYATILAMTTFAYCGGPKTYTALMKPLQGAQQLLQQATGEQGSLEQRLR